MPNWCYNSLSVMGDKDEIQRFQDKAVGKSWHPKTEVEILSFNQFVPMPKDLAERCADDSSRAYSDEGYDWEHKNWGVKWGACGDINFNESEGYLHYQFETPWGPPEEFIKRVSQQFKKLEFDLEFEEPGMAFQGGVTYQNGEMKKGWEKELKFDKEGNPIYEF